MKKETKLIRKKIFDFDGSFYACTGKIFDLMLVSIYWVVGCIPVITAGAAFSALYAAVMKSIRQDRNTVSRQFWHSYKQNLTASIPLTLIYGSSISLMLLNIGILRRKMNSLPGLFFMVFYAMVIALLVIAACYTYPALSRFSMPWRWFLKLSFYMTVKHMPVSLLLLLMFFSAYFALLAHPVLFLILPGVLTYVGNYMIDPLLDSHMPKEEKA